MAYAAPFSNRDENGFCRTALFRAHSGHSLALPLANDLALALGGELPTANRWEGLLSL